MLRCANLKTGNEQEKGINVYIKGYNTSPAQRIVAKMQRKDGGVRKESLLVYTSWFK